MSEWKKRNMVDLEVGDLFTVIEPRKACTVYMKLHSLRLLGEPNCVIITNRGNHIGALKHIDDVELVWHLDKSSKATEIFMKKLKCI